MATPLYRKLKQNGATIYTFPGSAEDLSAEMQNDNYKFRFSKYVLLNIRVEDLDFDVFETESNQTLTDNGDKLVQSLRNYVANQEIVIRESKLNQREYFYDPNQLGTVSEKVFWKWLRKVGGIEFEPADPNDEYVDSAKFQIDENQPTDYFKEYVWRERKRKPIRIQEINTNVDTNVNVGTRRTNAQFITLQGSSNLKPGDFIRLHNVGTIDFGVGVGESRVLEILPSLNQGVNSVGDSRNNQIRVDVGSSSLTWNNFAVAEVELEYDRTVQYIGEISAVNNAQVENQAWTEIYATLPAQMGQTPDILFRIEADKNYGPGLQFPILSSQDQPEIVGGEQATSPLVTNPDQFPGDQYALFDQDQKYLTSAGYRDRRRGPYYGIPNALDRRQNTIAQAPYVWPEFDGSNLDGISLDFDPSDYTRMNIPGQVSRNFDEFNQKIFNNQPPKDFEFNAILWFYEVEDVSQLGLEVETETDTETVVGDNQTQIITTTTRTQTQNNVNANKEINLYGITILNGINQDIYNPADRNIPTYKKLVSTNQQDGTSYTFSLNLNFKVADQPLQEIVDPNKVYNLFGFDKFNEVMNMLAQTNSKYVNSLNDLVLMKQDMLRLKSLIYSQTDLQTINQRIANLNQMLNLYRNLQIAESETVAVELDNSQSPPRLKLNTQQTGYVDNIQLPVSTLYDVQTGISFDKIIEVPKNRDFLVSVINDDQQDIALNGELNLILNRDLDYLQTCTILVWPDQALFNKKLKISINTSLVNENLFSRTSGWTIIDNIDLPIDLNTSQNDQVTPLSSRWNAIPNQIPVSKAYIAQVSDSFYINLAVSKIYGNVFRLGDVIRLPNLVVRISNGDQINLSNQYSIATETIIDTTGLEDQHEIQILIDPTQGRQIFDDLRIENPGLNKIEIGTAYFSQPIFIEINSGWKIVLKNIDRVSTNLNEKYSLEILPYRKKNLLQP